jgi:hypothetical protein
MLVFVTDWFLTVYLKHMNVPKSISKEVWYWVNLCGGYEKIEVFKGRSGSSKCPS